MGREARCATISGTASLIIDGLRPSRKQADRRDSRLRRRSVSRSSRPPASLVMEPASNEASTRREKCPAKVNPDWLHSVIAKAVLLLALTVVWKLSYATEGGLLPIVREKCGLSPQKHCPAHQRHLPSPAEVIVEVKQHR